MTTETKPISELRTAEFAAHPVWTFARRPGVTEVLVRPIKRLPVSSSTGKLFGSRVLLSNGTREWALMGNVDKENARLNAHFVTISFGLDGKWFHLARYHDYDFDERGPAELAAFLSLPVDEIFPIRYDLTGLVRGDSQALCGEIRKEPLERLTRDEVISLAVWG